MESCEECLRLENRLRAASEHYVNLIVQRDQMLRNANPKASTVESVMRQARFRRNAAGRIFLDHRINHEALSRPKTKRAGQL